MLDFLMFNALVVAIAWLNPVLGLAIALIPAAKEYLKKLD